MGVVRMYRWLVGFVVRRYNNRFPHNNNYYYFSLLHLIVLALFLQQHPYFFVHFLRKKNAKSRNLFFPRRAR